MHGYNNVSMHGSHAGDGGWWQIVGVEECPSVTWANDHAPMPREKEKKAGTRGCAGEKAWACTLPALGLDAYWAWCFGCEMSLQKYWNWTQIGPKLGPLKD